MQLGIRNTVELCNKGAKAPSRVLMFRDGNVGIDKKTMKDVALDRESAEEIIAEFDRRGIKLVIDYNHATQRMQPGQQAPAAGWMTALVFEPGVGLLAEVEWTDDAARAIEAQEYKYLSPVMMVDTTRNRIFRLDTAALTNTPATNFAVELVAAESSDWSPCELDETGGIKLIDRSEPMKKKTKVALQDDVIETPDGKAVVDELVAAAGKLADQVRAAGGELEEGADAITVMAMAGDLLAGKTPDEAAAVAVSKRTVTEEMAEALGVEKGSTMTVACEAASKLRIKGGSADSQTERLVILEQKMAERDKADATAAVDAFIEEHVEAGRLNPNDEGQMKAVRCLAESNMGECQKFVESLTPIGKTEKTDFTGGGTNGSRERFMADSRKYWNNNPTERVGCSVEAWVNGDLTTAEMDGLTTAEREKLGVS